MRVPPGLSSRIFLQSFNLLRLIKLNTIKPVPFSGRVEKDAAPCYAAFVWRRRKASLKPRKITNLFCTGFADAQEVGVVLKAVMMNNEVRAKTCLIAIVRSD